MSNRINRTVHSLLKLVLIKKPAPYVIVCENLKLRIRIHCRSIFFIKLSSYILKRGSSRLFILCTPYRCSVEYNCISCCSIHRSAVGFNCLRRCKTCRKRYNKYNKQAGSYCNLQINIFKFSVLPGQLHDILPKM